MDETPRVNADRPSPRVSLGGGDTPDAGDRETVATNVDRTIRGRRPVWTWILLALGLLLVGAAVGWAGTLVLRPAEDVLDTSTFTYAEVVPGEVGSSLSFNTVAAWTTSPVAANLAAGTVTTVNVEPGQEVGFGAVLYTVNLRPTVIAQGGIPAFRDLTVGAAGADVAQLQVMLASLGFYNGPTDGGFGRATESAVESWQESLGVEPTGAVLASDVVFVPTLPTRIALDTDKLRRGAVLSGGEAVVLALPDSPSFTIPLASNQATLVPTGARVQITGPSGEEWEGIAQQQKTTESGVDVVLAGQNGQAICGKDCATIPIVGLSALRSRIITVETVSGLTAPSAALLSGANGEAYVIDDEGAEHRVTVLASAKGMSIIRGVAEGLMVRVPAAGQ